MAFWYETEQYRESMMQYFLSVKVVFAGDNAVGKTSLLVRYTEDAFLTKPKATVTVDHRMKTVNVEDEKITFQIWDTAGQERFSGLPRAYSRDAVGMMLVYDVSRKKSFLNVQAWISDVRAHTEDVMILLLGNKNDVHDNDRAVSFEQGEQLAETYGVPFYETSALTGSGVDRAFETLAKLIKAKLRDPTVQQVAVLQPQKRWCCTN